MRGINPVTIVVKRARARRKVGERIIFVCGVAKKR